MSLVQAVEQMEDEIAKLKQECDELAAQVSKAKEFIQMLANSTPADDMDSTPFDAQEFLDSFPTGPAALREIEARTLEEAKEEFYLHKNHTSDEMFVDTAIELLDNMAAAKRKGE